MSTESVRRASLSTLACLALAATFAHADTTFTQRTKVRGAGDLGPMEIVKTVRISRAKAREESSIKFNGSAARDAGAKPVGTIGIILLDRSVVQTLDPGERTFTERSIPDVRADLQKLAAEADTSIGCAEAPGAAPVVTVNPTSEMRKIGVWDARLATIATRTEVVDLKTGLKRDAEVVLDLWMATDVPGQDEIRAFDSARASRIGLASEIFPALSGFAGGFPRSMEKIRGAYDNLPGYPVRWTFTVRTDLSPEERAALADAAKLQEEGADPTVGQQEREGSADLADPLARVETRSPASAQDKHPPHPLEPAAGEHLTTTSADQEVETERGRSVLVRVDTVLESASTGTVDPDLFEIPKGFSPAPATPR